MFDYPAGQALLYLLIGVGLVIVFILPLARFIGYLQNQARKKQREILEAYHEEESRE